MPQFIKDLYEKNKALAWIVGIIILPAVALFFFKDIAMTLLAKGSQQDLNSAIKKDEVLKTEIASLKTEAFQHEAKAEDLDKKANEVKADDEDWQKKRGNVKLTLLAALVLFFGSLFFIRNAYQTHYPVADVGDCIVFFEETTAVSVVVLENKISDGYLIGSGVIIDPDSGVLYFGPSPFSFYDLRLKKYEVNKGCM